MCWREARFGLEELAHPALDHAPWCSKVAILADLLGPRLFERLWKWKRVIGPFQGSRQRWRYRLAADQGDADAQFNLGIMYENGRRVPQDETEAVRWYRLAADQGFAREWKPTVEP